MKYVPKELMRRGTSVGKEREDNEKHVKYVLEERMRGGRL